MTDTVSGNKLTPVQEMNKVVQCLYLELPEVIANDVKRKWEAAYEFLSPSVAEEIKGSEGRLFVWNGIEGQLEEIEQLEDVKAWVSDYTDQEEGIHPDIESIIVLKEIAGITCTPIEGKENTFKVEIKSLPTSTETAGELYGLIRFVKNLEYMNGTKPQFEFTEQEIYESFIKKS